MKKLINVYARRNMSVSEYRGYTIYLDSDSAVYYIYLDDRGNKRVSFPDMQELEEYVDDMLEGKYRTYAVRYIKRQGTAGGEAYGRVTVKAKNMQDARSKAADKAGKDCYRIVDVWIVDDDER